MLLRGFSLCAGAALTRCSPAKGKGSQRSTPSFKGPDANRDGLISPAEVPHPAADFVLADPSIAGMLSRADASRLRDHVRGRRLALRRPSLKAVGVTFRSGDPDRDGLLTRAESSFEPADFQLFDHAGVQEVSWA